MPASTCESLDIPVHADSNLSSACTHLRLWMSCWASPLARSLNIARKSASALRAHLSLLGCVFRMDPFYISDFLSGYECLAICPTGLLAHQSYAVPELGCSKQLQPQQAPGGLEGVSRLPSFLCTSLKRLFMKDSHVRPESALIRAGR
jgi:hypothetical protein